MKQTRVFVRCLIALGLIVFPRIANAQDSGEVFLPVVVRVDPPPDVIAFSYNGKILLLDPQSVAPTATSSGAMGNQIFRWGSSGQMNRFARIQDGSTTLMTAGPDGANLQVLATLGPETVDIAWSPDGQQVATVRFEGDNFDIYIMRPDGSDARPLVTGPGYRSDLQWPPDSSKIAFSYAPLGTLDLALYVIDISGQNLTKISEDVDDAFGPRWAPDGSRIVFESLASSATTNNEIVAVNADGTGLTNLTNHPGNDGGPAWSPDGSQIAFISSRNNEWNLYLMQADGSNQRSLSQAPGFYQHLRWSPDGSLLAFIKDYAVQRKAHAPSIIIPPESIYDLGIIDPRTGSERRLTYGLAPFGFVWSVPDD